MKRLAVGGLAFGGLMLLYLIHPVAGLAALSGGLVYTVRRTMSTREDLRCER